MFNIFSKKSKLNDEQEYTKIHAVMKKIELDERRQATYLDLCSRLPNVKKKNITEMLNAANGKGKYKYKG